VPEASECTFVKTHDLPPEGSNDAAVYVLRDGRDSYVSYAHYAMTRFPGEYGHMAYPDVLRTLVQSTQHFAGWSSHVNAWLNRSGPTAVLRYEDMLANPDEAVQAACALLSIRLPEPSGVLPTFEEQHARMPLSVRKGRAGSWREEMPADIEECFWSMHGQTMERVGYVR
jgi:hypothetical protein